jgi:hypothetical protein
MTLEEAMKEVDDEINSIHSDRQIDIAILKEVIELENWNRVIASASLLREHDAKLRILYQVWQKLVIQVSKKK